MLMEPMSDLERFEGAGTLFTVRHSLPPSWVRLLTHVDYHRRVAIVAERETADGPTLIGVGRYDAGEPPDTAEIALVVEDAWQAHGIRTFRVVVLADNRRMVQLLVRETQIMSRTTSQGVTEALVQAKP